MDPLRPLDTLMMRLTRRMSERDRVLVERGYDAAPGLYRWVLVRWLVGLAALMVMVWFDDGGLTGLAAATLGGVVGSWAMSTVRRCGTYRTGWVDGRNRMRDQLRAQQQRGGTLEDWMDTELSHDLTHVFGLPPMPYRRGER